MKQLYLLFALLCLCLNHSMYAQNEIPADSITSSAPPESTPLPDGIKSYDGFLLDMNGLMNSVHTTTPRHTLQMPEISIDYSRLFRLNTNAIYTQGLSDMFSPAGSMFYSLSPFGLYGFGNATDNLQMGSFRLKNNWRINTYGEYNKEGYKVYNPSALPWEKDNFKGAFELKSSDGSFGIRVEVQKGRDTPF